MDNNNKYNWDELAATLAAPPVENPEAPSSGPAKIFVASDDPEVAEGLAPVLPTAPVTPPEPVSVVPEPAESHLNSWNKDHVAARPTEITTPVLEKIELSVPTDSAATPAPVFSGLSLEAEQQAAEIQREIAEVRSWAIAVTRRRRSGVWVSGLAALFVLAIGGWWWTTSWTGPTELAHPAAVNSGAILRNQHPKTKTALAPVKIKVKPLVGRKIKVKTPLKAAAAARPKVPTSPLKIARPTGATHPAATNLKTVLQSYYSLRQIEQMAVPVVAQAYTWPELLQILLRLPENQTLLSVPRRPELRQSVTRYQSIARIHKLQATQALDPDKPLALEDIQEVIKEVQTRSSLLK